MLNTLKQISNFLHNKSDKDEHEIDVYKLKYKSKS